MSAPASTAAPDRSIISSTTFVSDRAMMTNSWSILASVAGVDVVCEDPALNQDIGVSREVLASNDVFDVHAGEARLLREAYEASNVHCVPTCVVEIGDHRVFRRPR